MPEPSVLALAVHPAASGMLNASKPSVSVNEILQVGVVKVSCPQNVRPSVWSVKAIGSESTNCEVGAWLIYQLAFTPLTGQLSSNFRKAVCRSDWNAVIPFVVSCVDCQLTPMEGSPASCAKYSTVFAAGPWLLDVTFTNVPGASKFSKPM